MSRYALWFIPKGENYEIFSKIISDFAKKYSLPKFEPHVTLLGGFEMDEEEVISKADSLAALLSPFSVSLTNIECFDSPHKALIVNAELNNELEKTHQKAQEIFNQPTKSYKPHLSLAYGVYGQLSEKDKKSMVNRVGAKHPKTLEFDTLTLFNIDDKNEEKWFKVAKFTLY